jgi:protein-disulfide isomerase
MQGLKEDKLNYLPLVLAVTLVGLLVVVVTSNGSSVGKASVSPQDSKAIKRTETLLAGIPQHGAVIGHARAPVTLQFFADLQCADSRRVMLGALPFLIRHWVRDGKLRILFRSLETDTHYESEFLGQQRAALAAGRQGKMWTFVDIFYREQRPEFTRYADDAFLERIAEQAGVNLEPWEEDRESEGMGREIESDEAIAETKSMNSTPSFLIGATGGEARPLRHFSFEEPAVFDEAIRELLQAGPQGRPRTPAVA